MCFLPLGLILVLVTVLAYLNSFPGAFHFDDFGLMLESPLVNQEGFPYSIFLDQYGGRPLTLWSFHWTYRFFGEDPFPYHLCSVLLHAVVVLSFFSLILQLFRSRLLAFQAGLIFALHPLQTQAVNFIWSRSVLLAACFGVWAMLSVRKHFWIALICFQLAVWSRADALVVALLLIYLNPARWREILSVVLINAAALVYSLVVYLPEGIGWNHYHPILYWVAQPVVFWKYLSLMIWPSGLNIDHAFSWPSSWGLLIASLAVIVLLVAVYGLRTCQVSYFGLLWLMAALLPPALVPNSDLINESRTYLALGGLALLVSWLLQKLREFLPRVQLGTALLLIMMMISVTMARNELWKDDLLLWKDAALKSPGKARVHYNLGVALAQRGEVTEAERRFRLSRNLNPLDDLSYAALGYCAEMRGQEQVALGFYRKASQLNPHNDYARRGLARIFHTPPTALPESTVLTALY